MAGLYEFWKDPSRDDDDPLKWLVTCTVITTDAEDQLGRIHDRMPMMIDREHWAEWLDPKLTDTSRAAGLLVPAESGRLTAYAVSTDVNNVRNNGPDLIKPLQEEGKRPFSKGVRGTANGHPVRKAMQPFTRCHRHKCPLIAPGGTSGESWPRVALIYPEVRIRGCHDRS
ncbi:SOS response-associated peptidase [Nonomuraea antimicrobica]